MLIRSFCHTSCRRVQHLQVLLNGQPSSMSHGTAAYITQEGVLIGSLTVLECLMFIARLRLPTALSAATKRDVVDSILAEMGLHSCKDTCIGTWPAKGISGKPLFSLLQPFPVACLLGKLSRHVPS